MQQQQEQQQNLIPSNKIYKNVLIFLFYTSIFLCYIGNIFGYPKKTIQAHDSSQMACGYDLDLKKYPFAYFVNPQSQYINRIVCVAECPKQSLNEQLKPLNCSTNSVVRSCDQLINIFEPEKTQIVYDSFPFKNKICIPTTLDYFIQIAPASVPSTYYQILNDLSNTFWITMILPSIIAFILSIIVMKLIRTYTEVMVWLIIFIILIVVACSGLYFSKRSYQSYYFQEQSDFIGDFKVSQEFINKKTDTPNFTFNFLLTIVFAISTLYGGYYITNNYERIDGLCKFFKIINQYENSHISSNEITYLTIILYLGVFGLYYYFVIELLSFCIIDENNNLGPFEKIKPHFLSYFAILIIITAYWILCLISSFLDQQNYYSQKNWLLDQLQKAQSITDDNILFNQYKLNARRQFQQLHFHIEFSWYFFFCRLNSLLMLYPIIFIADSIRDTIQNMQESKLKKFLQKLFYFAYWIYEKGQDIEEFIYIEDLYQKKPQSVSQLRKLVRDVLKENYQRESYELLSIFFNYQGNVGQFFILSLKLFFTLIVAIILLFVLQLDNYNKILYSPIPPTCIGVFLAYNVCSFQLVVYSSGFQLLSYIYIKEHDLINSNLTESEIKKYQIRVQLCDAAKEILLDLQGYPNV